jgi:predicted PurR-regulated permease PerM
MLPKALSFYFLLAFLAGMFTVSFFIFKPFFAPVVLAAVFAVAFQKPYRRIRAVVWSSAGVGAALTTLLIVLVIVTPLAILGTQVAREAGDVYRSLADTRSAGTVFDSARVFLGDTIPLDIGGYLKNFLAYLAGNAGVVVSGVAKFLVDVVLFVMASYYFLKDGSSFRRAFISLSPLMDEDDEEIARMLGRAVNSIVTGRLLMAVVQGLLAMGGFFAFGIPNAVLWGSVTAITALIPGIGTALTIVPAAAYLFLSGAHGMAAGLAVYGAVVVGLADNVLGPHLIGRGVSLHPFVILLSVLGGIALFGPTGFVLGPLAISLLYTLLNAYHRDTAC